ncbi:head tail connector protein [Caudoviricetes sp.]|nr:head tail connector protein [Caudoviricetes sp.]
MDSIRRITELTAPAEEPVSLADMKAHLRITNSLDDAWLTAAIKAARMAAEDYTGRAFIQRTFRQTMDGVCGKDDGEWWDGVREAAITVLSPRTIDLLKPPLVSVQNVKAWDDSDTATTVSPTVYFVDTSDQNQPGRVVLRRGQTWPIVLRVANGLTIDFTAGFSANAAGLPADIVQAIKVLVAWIYVNRGDCADAASCSKAGMIPSGAAIFLDSYKIMRF